MGATLTALRALHPRGVPTYPQLPVQHGGMPHLRFSRHSLWKGRSVSFTSYLFNVNTSKPGAILTLIRLFLDIIPLLVNDGDKSSFFKQSVGPSSTWTCLISVRWSERGWHAFSHGACRLKICNKSRSYRWCSLRCFLYYSVVIRLLCFCYKFFYLTQFDILRSCFFLINFFRLSRVGTVPLIISPLYFNVRALFGRHHSIQFTNNTSKCKHKFLNCIILKFN